MSTKLSHRQADQLPVGAQERVIERTERPRRVKQGVGVHRDQNWDRGGRWARGGRNGERAAILRAAFRGEI